LFHQKGGRGADLLADEAPAGGQVAHQRVMVDDQAGGGGGRAHAAHVLHRLRVHQDHMFDAAPGQVFAALERQHVPVDRQKRVQVAVALVRQDGDRVRIEAGGRQEARQRVEVGVFVRQNDGVGCGHGRQQQLYRQTPGVGRAYPKP